MPEALTERERQIVAQIQKLTAELVRSTSQRKPDRKYAGPAPYGYSRQVIDGEKQLIPNPTEQAVIARIVELRAKDTGLKIIAADLNDAGHRTRSGGEFVFQDVARILKGKDKL